MISNLWFAPPFLISQHCIGLGRCHSYFFLHSFVGDSCVDMDSFHQSPQTIVMLWIKWHDPPHHIKQSSQLLGPVSSNAIANFAYFKQEKYETLGADGLSCKLQVS